jgi:HlyD family secretion protein
VKRIYSAAVLFVAVACSSNKVERPTVQVAKVQLRNITIDAQATGIVEAINVVEVKSKASGMVIKMPVETGDFVKIGDLIAQVDTRDVLNGLDQAKADLQSAEESERVAAANKVVSDELYKQRVITEQENRAASLELTRAKTAILKLKASLDQAQQRFEDATVTASSAGIILEKTVAPGVVIASATGSVSGGSILVKMADLTKVRVRARFNETDIGMIRAGQTATVSVDAYPDRPFEGLVEKIEPQAVIQQNVTMFPVLITLSNEENLLKPGMNGEVSVLVDEAQSVLAVPNDAIRNARELPALATMLDLHPDTAAAMLARGGGTGGNGRAATDGGPSAAEAPAASGDTRGAVQVPAGAGRGGDSAAARPRGSDTSAARRSGGGGDGGSASAGGNSGGGRSSARGGGGRGSRSGGVGGAGRGGRGGAAGAARSARGDASARGARAKTGLVFVRDSMLSASAIAAKQTGWRTKMGFLAKVPLVNKLGFAKADTSAQYAYSPRNISIGRSNYDFTEILGGVKAGDEVVLLGALAAAIQRAAQQEQMKKGMASPLNPNAAPMGPGGGGPRGGGGGGNPGGGKNPGGGGGGGNAGGGRGGN